MNYEDNYSLENPSELKWRLHLKSPPKKVYEFISTDEGRMKFWAEVSKTNGKIMSLKFADGLQLECKIIETEPYRHFSFDYWGKSVVTFLLKSDGQGGTDFTVTDFRSTDKPRLETLAGWVSLLLTLKAAVDFRVDLRNHDTNRTWDNGYVDN
ncbi:MAG: hypothetical protein QXV32_05310 [Conexivisphaerales archaeon]